MSFKYCLVQYLEWQAQNKKHKKLLKCEDCPFYKKCELKGELKGETNENNS